MHTTRIALGLVLLLALGACSAQEPEVVVNEQVPAEQQIVEGGGEGGEGGEGEDAGAGADFASADAVWVAEQLAFIEAPTEISSGDMVIGLEIIGGLPHNVVFEGFEGDRELVEGEGEGQFAAAVSIPAGDYTYYCSIAGHRAAGMEGTIAVV